MEVDRVERLRRQWTEDAVLEMSEMLKSETKEGRNRCPFNIRNSKQPAFKKRVKKIIRYNSSTGLLCMAQCPNGNQ